LPAAQKAAAVNLGIFPDPGSTQYAYAAPQAGDRFDAIDDFLKAPALPPPSTVQQPTPQPLQVAYSIHSSQRQAQPAKKPSKVWLQLASGPNTDALQGQFRRMKSRNEDLFDGIKGYVAKGRGRSRLVIGPFRGPSDAKIFAEDLDSVGIDAFSWSNSPTDTIVPLGTE
jgi:hypothetical protein